MWKPDATLPDAILSDPVTGFNRTADIIKHKAVLNYDPIQGKDADGNTIIVSKEPIQYTGVWGWLKIAEGKLEDHAHKFKTVCSDWTLARMLTTETIVKEFINTDYSDFSATITFNCFYERSIAPKFVTKPEHEFVITFPIGPQSWALPEIDGGTLAF